jgi:nucleotide-binding universal stress UspA family protein
MQLQNIVFPVDFSARSYAAAPFIQSMARWYEGTVSLVHAIEPLQPLYFEVGALCPDAADAARVEACILAHLREFAEDQFPHMETACTVLTGDPADAILDFAKSDNADLLALPTHGYGLFRRALLGSVITKVLHRAAMPVWTSAHCCEPTHRAHPQPRRIIAAVDLAADREAETERVVQKALVLANVSGASVEILHVAGEKQISAEFRRTAMARAVVSAASSTAVLVDQQESAGLPVEVNDEKVELAVRRVALLKRADLVVIGRGRHAYAIICESPCPVLSV